MLSGIGGVRALAVTAVMGVTQVFGCNGCDTFINTVVTPGPDIHIVGPDTVVAGKPATFSVVDQGLGHGKPCPQRVNWAFSEEDYFTQVPDTDVSVTHVKTHRDAHGDCVIGPEAVTVPQTFLGPDAQDSSDSDRAIVNVELGADGGVDRADGSKTITVQRAPASNGQPAPPAPTPPSTTTTGARTPTFGATTQYPTSAHAFGVVAADLDLSSTGAPTPDGRADVAESDDDTISTDFQDISFFASHADGTLASSSMAQLSPGTAPRGIVSADFNQDGLPDVAAAESATDRVAVVWHDTTDNGFQTPLEEPTGGGPIGIATADFNGDGRPDVVTADVNSNKASVLLNEGGTNGMQAPIDFDSGGTAPVAVAAGDVNGDGKPDIVLANAQSGTVTVLLNTSPAQSDPGPGAANATFAAAKVVASGLSDPDAVTVASFNGQPGIAVADGDANAITVLTQSAASSALTFSSATYTDASGQGPDGIAAGDFNGDGHPDLVTANAQSDNATVWTNNGDGTFGGTPAHLSAGVTPQAVAVGDVNGDGKADIVVGNSGTGGGASAGSLSVALNTTPSAAQTRASIARARARRRPRTTSYTAQGSVRVTGISLGRGTYRADGTGHLQNVAVSLHLGARVRARRVAAGLLDLLNADLFAKGSVDRFFVPVEGNPILATGLAVGRSTRDRRVLACVRLSEVRRTHDRFTQRLTVIGATGAAAGIRLTADFPPGSIDRPLPAGRGAFTITVGRGSRQRLPRGCGALTRRLPHKRARRR